jgi:hypothetical protein
MSQSPSPDRARDQVGDPARDQVRDHAEFWFDPTCPWAWMTSRWMLEVTTMRPVDVTWNLFSLSVLNEGRELSESYSRRMVRAWRPIRVLAAALEQAGPQVVLPLYTAIGTRLHPGGRRDHDPVLAEALVEVGLSSDLVAAADTDERDHLFRQSTARAIALVGDDVGTPVISVNGVAFFGPVVTPAPRGEVAGRLWDGAVAVASVPGFYEIKRSRTEEPSF